jgi:CRP/FNR family transcriptional regulator, cyclic AMP receptor protein
MGGDLFDYPTGGGVAVPEFPLLAEASSADWEVVRRHGELRRYRTGERVSGAHDTDRVLWLVVDGCFAVVSGGGSEEEYGAGAVFGELTFLTGAPDEATVHARRDGSVLRLRLADLEVLAGLHPVLARHLLFDLARLLAWRVRELRRAAQR